MAGRSAVMSLSPLPLGQPGQEEAGPTVEAPESPPQGPCLSGLLGQPSLRHRTPFGKRLTWCPDPNGPCHTPPGKQPLPWALGSGWTQALGLPSSGQVSSCRTWPMKKSSEYSPEERLQCDFEHSPPSLGHVCNMGTVIWSHRPHGDIGGIKWD